MVTVRQLLTFLIFCRSVRSMCALKDVENSSGTRASVPINQYSYLIDNSNKNCEYPAGQNKCSFAELFSCWLPLIDDVPLWPIKEEIILILRPGSTFCSENGTHFTTQAATYNTVSRQYIDSSSYLQLIYNDEYLSNTNNLDGNLNNGPNCKICLKCVELVAVLGRINNEKSKINEKIKEAKMDEALNLEGSGTDEVNWNMTVRKVKTKDRDVLRIEKIKRIIPDSLYLEPDVINKPEKESKLYAEENKIKDGVHADSGYSGSPPTSAMTIEWNLNEKECNELETPVPLANSTMVNELDTGNETKAVTEQISVDSEKTAKCLKKERVENWTQNEEGFRVEEPHHECTCKGECRDRALYFVQTPLNNPPKRLYYVPQRMSFRLYVGFIMAAAALVIFAVCLFKQNF